jgi:hypothetical protein
LSRVRLFTFKREFIKELSVDLQAALAAERHLSKEECLEKELKMVNFVFHEYEQECRQLGAQGATLTPI